MDPDFRFTAHVYPPLLIAAAVSVSALVRGGRALIAGNCTVDPAGARVSWPAWGGVVGVAVVALWFVWRGGPAFAFAEALRAHEEGTVMAGVRDGWSFRSGWSNVMRSGNVSVRVAAEEAALSIRLPEAGDYPITIRMDPFPRPIDASIQSAAAVEVALNGAHVTTIPLRWTAGRMGAYRCCIAGGGSPPRRQPTGAARERFGLGRGARGPSRPDARGSGGAVVRSRAAPGRFRRVSSRTYAGPVAGRTA